MTSEARDYPSEICVPCGNRYGKPRSGVATFYVGTCGWCGMETIVTEPRDYCYPKWSNRNDQ
jgi:hypothetical protein